MLRYRYDVRLNLVASRLHGDFDLAQALGELDRAYRAGLMARGRDRATLADADFDLCEVPVGDIYAFREALARWEARIGGSGRFRWAVVVDPAREIPAVETYFALRRAAGNDAPEMRVVRSIDAAGAFLGVQDLARAFPPRLADPETGAEAEAETEARAAPIPSARLSAPRSGESVRPETG